MAAQNEDVSPSRKRQYLAEALRILAEKQGPISPRSVFDQMKDSLRPNGVEMEAYPTQPGIPRFETITRFYTIRAARAGWMIKRGGLWEITPSGIQALSQYKTSDALAEAVGSRYKEWLRSRSAAEAASADDSSDGIPDSASLTAFNLEDAKERNKAALESRVRALQWYEVQDMMAALLRAMGYHVAHVSERGRGDKGVDIIAFRDPLGSLLPRMKVQVKHREQIGRPEIDKFVGSIRSTDIGVFLSTGGFSSDARVEARAHKTHDLTLIDLEELIDLWTQYYKSVEESSKHFLPLEAVFFLSNEL